MTEWIFVNADGRPARVPAEMLEVWAPR